MLTRTRGRHRARPTHRTAARVAAVGALTAGAAAVTIAPASAAPAGPDWGAVIACESGGNPTAQNRSSTASGLFQFLDSTWRSLGGTGRARDASVAEQTRIANLQHAKSGYSAWAASKSCWAGKTGKVAPKAVTPRVAKAAPKAAPAPKRAAAAPAAPRRAAVATPPVKTSKAKPVAPKRAAAPKVGTSVPDGYVIRPGDTLSRIAARHHVVGGYRALAAANGIANPNRIFAGATLR